MLKKVFLSCIALPVCMSLALIVAARPQVPASLTAAQIVEKNVSAKGGLQAWRAVQTMSFSGKMDAGGKQKVQLPFVLERKRPRKTRTELVFANDTAVQVYDGDNGWKLRPFLGRRDVEPYSPEELKSASFESDLDGPLVDYAAKGNKVELEGLEKVEDHDAYKLKLTMKGGQVQHIWVDAGTFLEVKVEGTPRRVNGKMRPVSIYLRDYKDVNGLMIPYVSETAVQGNRDTHKMIIESVVVNPKLEDSLFTKPSPQPQTQAKSK
jgi:outer membrane lipoprotein-sorting protein